MQMKRSGGKAFQRNHFSEKLQISDMILKTFPTFAKYNPSHVMDEYYAWTQLNGYSHRRRK